MIDPIQLFPKLDGDKEMPASQDRALPSPLASELQKDVPTFVLGGNRLEQNVHIEEVRSHHLAMLQDRESQVIAPEIEEALDSEELREQIHNLKERLWEAKVFMQDVELDKLAEEHLEAYKKVTDLINEDLYEIATHTQQQPAKKKEEPSVTRKVLDWVSSGEEILNRALLYFSDRDGKEESIANFLKVQYAVQRATQRAELFASIVGTTVSSVKTIMTTQLG